MRILLLLALLLLPGLAQADPLVVAVLPFSNNSGDPAWDPLGRGLSEMMTTDLARSPSLIVVERVRLQEVLTELALQNSSDFDPTSASEIGRLVGATHLAFGSLVALTPDLRLDVRLVSAAGGKVLVAESVTGQQDRFFALETALSGRLLAGLPDAIPPTPRRQTDDLADVAEYGRALEEADAGDYESASRRLGTLVREEPDFVLAQEEYEAVVRALMASRVRRESLLDEAAAEFFTATQARIKASDPTARDADDHFGTLIARQKLQLDLLIKLGDGGAISVTMPSSADYPRQVREWLTTIDMLLASLKRRRAAGMEPPTFPSLPNDLDAMIDRSNLEADPNWAFLSEWDVAGDTAMFLVLGDAPLRIEDLDPPPVARDDRLGDRALELIDLALAECELHEGRYKERELVRLHQKKAKLLVALDRRAQAIAELQMTLDRFPRADEYDSVEEALLDLLGMK